MSLSDNLHKDTYLCLEYLYVADVKKFIKELKEFPKKSKFGPFNPVFIELEEFIDELAGEALI